MFFFKFSSNLMQNFSGVTIQDGKVKRRGNDKIAVLIDEKQNAVTFS